MHPDAAGAGPAGTDGRLGAAHGIGVVAALVARTLGPAGQPAIIRDAAGGDIEAPDAETIVARFVPDDRQSLGASYVRDLVRDQHAAAGDGAATAVVLADAMVSRAAAAVPVGADPVGLTHGIQAALNRVLDELGRRATDVGSKEEIAAVIAAAIFDRALAGVLAEAFDKVGKEGVIIVEPAGPAAPDRTAGSAGPGLRLALSHGMSVDGGYVSARFVTDADRGEAVLRDACLLLVDREVTAAEDLLPAIDTAAAAGRPLVVLAGGVTGAALDALLASAGRGAPALAAWAAGDPGTRQAVLEDVAVLTGATVVGGSVTGGEAPQPASDGARSLGRAGKVVATHDSVIIVDAAGDEAALRDRIRQLRAQIESAETSVERQELFTRLAKFAGGAATVRVGGATSAETARRRALAERGLAIARLALGNPVNPGGNPVNPGANQIIPGGGAALADVQQALEKFPRSLSGRRWGHEAKDETIGARILLDSLTAPIRQLAENAGVPVSAVEKVLKSRKEGTGIDPATGKTVPMRSQAMDVLPVVQAAVANAASLTIRVLSG